VSDEVIETKKPSVHDTVSATDSLGRNLAIRRLSALEQLDFFECAGAAAGTSSWMAMAMVAVSVRMIDGVPCPFPRNKEGIRQAVAKLGMEGINAATVAFVGSDDAPSDDTIETAKN
jgi:hypothetical protein